MKKKIIFIICIVLLSVSVSKLYSQKIAGFRASRILQSYPNRQFPSADYWANVGESISKKFTGFNPGGVWIVSLCLDDGDTQFGFPSDGMSIPNVEFISVDWNEDYLTKFDKEGVKVWLQVEPGAANVDTLIDVVLNRYKKHSCVAGFGIDVEWLDGIKVSGGRYVNDAEAQRWEAKVKAVDSSYTLFLKHYSPKWMPPVYRGSILFVDDSQGFTSYNEIISEFKAWGNKFPKNNVAFQFGYAADKSIWSKYSDPMLQIGGDLIKQIPNCAALFWVDFTITQLFPVTAVNNNNRENFSFKLNQNYPNPFNPSTIISYELKEKTNVSLKIYDMLGRELITLVNGEQNAGLYEISFANNSNKLASGTYIYRLVSKNFSESKKFTILK
jgi:hypothetical protein